MDTIGKMTETITNIVKFTEEDNIVLHTLKIETIKNDKKWNAFICIHIPNHIMHIPMPIYICDFKLNGIIILFIYLFILVINK
jgi:hypothetical protein